MTVHNQIGVVGVHTTRGGSIESDDTLTENKFMQESILVLYNMVLPTATDDMRGYPSVCGYVVAALATCGQEDLDQRRNIVA